MDMKKITFLLLLFSIVGFRCSICQAQMPLKPRPDAFPPVAEPATKALNMATTVEEMASWDRYPTYETYLAMMSCWAENYPTLCHIDTIGTSTQGRLILSMYIQSPTVDEMYRPEFFYSSTIHGDEVTGYVLMLHLIDTLLSSYGTSPELTDLIDRTRISINPLANPDGTYYRGNNTVQGSRRYNADGVDLNRNYPNPFNPAKSDIPLENRLMIDYVSAHQFRLSANLHGGAEVANYPWDSFTSAQNPHPAADWWQEVCKRFVDTLRIYAPNHFNDVTDCGYIEGGDWYVITGGRQDYMNYYHNCLELTLEVSVSKTLRSERLPEYWHFLAPSLINYIGEIHSLPEGYNGIANLQSPTSGLTVYPNPVVDRLTVEGLNPGSRMSIYDMQGHLVFTQSSGSSDVLSNSLDLSMLPSGIYLLVAGGGKKIILKL